MSKIHWLNPISGSFTNPDDWRGGAVPGASDDAIISAVAKRPYTVTVSERVGVKSIQTSSDVRLVIDHGTFFASDGTGSGANAGIILVRHGKLRAGGEMTNSGSIVLGEGSRNGTLLASGYLSLGGGGEVVLNGDGESLIEGALHPKYSTLNNINNTIMGSGTIGVFLYNDVSGVVDANGATPLVVKSSLYNSGLMEATGGGNLEFYNIFEQNQRQNHPAGVVLAASDSTVTFFGGRLKNGTIETEGNGKIIADESYIQSVTNRGNFTITRFDNDLFDGITNYGSINMEGGCYIETNFTFDGGGVVNLGTDAYGNRGSMEGAAELVNVDNTIMGGWLIDDSALIENESHGTINGNGLSVLILTGSTMQNAGTIESTGVYGVHIDSQLDNEGLVVANTGTIEIGSQREAYSLTNSGTIGATGAGVVVIDSAIVNNGALSAQSGGVLKAVGAVGGDGVAVVNAGTLDFASSFNEAVIFTGAGSLELANSKGFTDSVTGFSADEATTLDLGDISFIESGEATFSGTPSGGVLTVTDGKHTAKINLIGDFLDATFVASSDHAGGTDVIAQSLEGPPSAHAFISAMADFGPPAGQALQMGMSSPAREPLLASPRVAIA